MALKNLPKTLVTDFVIFWSQSSIAVRQKFIQVVGLAPGSTYTPVFKNGGQVTSLLQQYLNTYILPSRGFGGIGSDAFIKNNPSTFSTQFKDTATWENQFFVLRTQLLGIVGGNSNDPAISQLDVIWLDYSKISGRWQVILREKNYKDKNFDPRRKN